MPDRGGRAPCFAEAEEEGRAVRPGPGDMEQSRVRCRPDPVRTRGRSHHPRDIIVFCIQSTESPMPAQLVKLQPAPDLVDQVYRALLAAISDGSLRAAQRITQGPVARRPRVACW